MNIFRTPSSVGVWQTFVAMAAIYFVFMLGGAFGYRLPPAGWRPDGWTPPPAERRIDDHQAPGASQGRAQDAAVLADLGRAVPERQRRHRRDRHGLADAAGDLRRLADRPARRDVRPARRPAAATVAAIAAGFTGLLSLFNIGGRFFWASLSDKIGRKTTYYTFFLLGIALYAACAMGGAYRQQGPVRGRSSASSCRCMAAASRPFRPISPTCSARSSSAPSTAGC